MRRCEPPLPGEETRSTHSTRKAVQNRLLSCDLRWFLGCWLLTHSGANVSLFLKSSPSPRRWEARLLCGRVMRMETGHCLECDTRPLAGHGPAGD